MGTSQSDTATLDTETLQGPPADAPRPGAPVPVETDRLYRMPVDVYHGMIEGGLLTERDGVVLLDGLLVKTMTKGPGHSSAAGRLLDLLTPLAPAGWHVRKEEPVTLPEGPGRPGSEPEPDLAVVRGGRDDYDDRHPGPGEVALVVEVARRSIRDDRAGLSRYARAGVPVAWIVNLNESTVEVYTRPAGPAAGYEDCKIYQKGDRLPVVVEGREVGGVAVSDLLPRA